MSKVKSTLAVNTVAYIEQRMIDVRNIAMILLAFTLLFPFAVHADGLFDFQMKLAKGGNAEAQYKVGEMYETGFGVKQDMTEARKWTSKAADKGNETATFKLLYWDVEKNGLKGGNKAKVDVLIKKAEDGNPQAQYFVGKMHASGVGVKKDPDKAIDWLNKAAFVGVLEAERELVVVREDKQRQALAARRAEEKKQAQLKAKQEKAKAKKEQQAKLEQQRKLKAEQDAKASANAKSAATANKKKADAAVLKKADQEEARKAKALAQKQAEARQREVQKQARLKKQAEEKQRKTQFESDPCSGKSARFLSTCR